MIYLQQEKRGYHDFFRKLSTFLNKNFNEFPYLLYVMDMEFAPNLYQLD